MENPFKFGGLVTGDDFADREAEIAQIFRELRGGTNVVMFSTRRMGKSSLIAEVMRRHKADFQWVYVDFYGVTSKSRMVELYMSALAKSVYGVTRKLADGLRELIRGSRFRLVFSESGEPAIELSRGEFSVPEIQEIMDIPEAIAKKRGKRVVVVFDEFQEVGPLDGVALLKAMRSRIQTHQHVSYIFAGSKKHLLMNIFEEREGAFYKSAVPMELGTIPKPDFEKFLVKRFAQTGGRIDRDIASGILDASGGNTYYVQQIAHELFDISNKPRYPEDLERAVTTALAHQSPVFQLLWDSVKSSSQRRYLLAVAQKGSESKSALVEQYGLKSLSHVQRAISQLDARGITEKGQIVDPMLLLWLKRLSDSFR